MKLKERDKLYEILRESEFSFEKFSILMELNGYGEREIFNTLYYYVPWAKVKKMIYEANEKGLVPEGFIKNMENVICSS